MMENEAFRDLVRRMRKFQTAWFSGKNRSDLIKAKKLELEVDRELGPEKNAPGLFDEPERVPIGAGPRRTCPRCNSTQNVERGTATLISCRFCGYAGAPR